MRTINVRVCHDDDLMIPRLLDIEFIRADTVPDGRNHCLDLLIGKNFIKA